MILVSEFDRYNKVLFKGGGFNFNGKYRANFYITIARTGGVRINSAILNRCYTFFPNKMARNLILEF